MASLGSEAGRDDPAEGSPLVGLAGLFRRSPSVRLSITLDARRRHSAATGATAAPPRAAARRERPLAPDPSG